MRFWHKYAFSLIFLGIVFVGLFLRVYRLTDVPYGFFCDEASIGYNAYEILTTGHDEYAMSYPIFFKAFGEYKNPIEIYSTVPSIELFGLNEFSVRIVSVLYGIGCIIALYFLVRELWREKNGKYIASFAILFLATSPWHIHMSRVALEGIIPYVFLVTLGTYFFLRSRNNIKFIFISSLFFSVGMYTYFPSRLFIPLWVLILCGIYIKDVSRNIKYMVLAFALACLLLSPYLFAFWNGSIFARWNEVSIFSQSSATASIASHIITNYIRHFSLDFLFLKGDAGMSGQFITRQSVKGMGELYLFQLPLLFLGVYYFLKKRRKEGILLLLWLFIYPTGSMFTTSDSPTATRSIIGIVPFTIFSAAGAYSFLEIVKKFFGKDYRDLTFLFLSAIIAISVYMYASNYFIQYPLYSSDFWGWQYGAQPVISYFIAHEHQYDELYMEGAFNAPYIFLDFYAPHDCTNCSIGDPKTNFNPTKKQLFAITPNYLQQNTSIKINKMATIYYPNRQPAFYIGEIKQ